MRRMTIALLAVLLGGCSTARVQPFTIEQVTDSKLLSAIQDGVTTREEVLLRLGSPSTQFEGERILTYELRIDDSHCDSRRFQW